MHQGLKIDDRDVGDVVALVNVKKGRVWRGEVSTQCDLSML